MKKNVYIVDQGSGFFLPYLYGLLRIFAEEDPVVAEAYQFKQPFFLNDPPEHILSTLENPAVVGLSCYVWNMRRQMKIARLVKGRFPDALVVCGGPQVPDRLENFFNQHPYLDVLVHGEGEAPFRALLRETLAPRPDWHSIAGVSFVSAGQTVTVPRGRLDISNLTRSPYTAGYLRESIEICRNRNLPYNALWETNRGCPYSCSFCDWGSSTMTKIRQFPLDRLLEDVGYFGEEEVRHVQINDANFGILPRDLQIAEALAEKRRSCGSPCEISVSFAKNSNQRVFDISQRWHSVGILNSTTLSMQAVNIDVLKAIARENIGVARYKELHKKYSAANIQTYTEIILGLPMETKQTFEEGLSEIFEMGSHDDLRVYELGMLPNAPMNDPENISKYQICTINKRLNIWDPNVPEDEQEFIPIVIQTKDMSSADWADMQIYSRLLQCLHNGCYTRYIAIHLWQHYKVPYHVFYSRLQEFFLSHPNSVLGLLCSTLKDYYARYLEDSEMPSLDVRRTPRRALEMLEKYQGFVVPVQWGWLVIAALFDRFYAEIQLFLKTLDIAFEDEFAELLRFQREIMLRPNYDPREGKRVEYNYDFPSSLLDAAPLAERKIQIHYRDTHTGHLGQSPLEKDNLAKFVHAAIGQWGAYTRRYQHQLDRAEISNLMSAASNC